MGVRFCTPLFVLLPGCLCRLFENEIFIEFSKQTNSDKNKIDTFCVMSSAFFKT
jgi:hypothetical protein